MVRGSLRVNGQALVAGDAVMLRNEPRVSIANGADAEVLVFDLNNGHGVIEDHGTSSRDDRSGSSRPGSFNGKLAAVAQQLAQQAGAQVTRLDLRALALPIYDAEVEAAGVPAGAIALRDALASHDALIVATPEYNAFPTPLLINAFDWASRTAASAQQPAGLAAMAGKRWA